MSIQKYIILDRDGVINKDSAEHIKSPDEWMPIPRSLEAIRLLTENNFHITVISNQSGINRGIISYKNFIGISNKMHQEIIDNGGKIDMFYYCPDTPTTKSKYRKPNPGMFLDFASRLGILLEDCYSIGDSPRDIIASQKVGCKAIGVRTGNGKKIEENDDLLVPIFDDLFDAAKYVLENDK
mgnify:CR=1 FL=1